MTNSLLYLVFNEWMVTACARALFNNLLVIGTINYFQACFILTTINQIENYKQFFITIEH